MFTIGRNPGDARQGARVRLWTTLGLFAIIGFGVVTTVYGVILATKPAQVEVRIGAGPKGSEVREVIEAIAEVAARHAPGVKVSLIDTEGTQENIQLLERGKIDVATAQSDAITRPNLRLIATLYPDLYQLLVRTRASINSVSDLTGRRIALSGARSGQARSFWFLIGQYNVPPESLHVFPMTARLAEQALKRGDVDALFRVRGPRNREIQWLIESADLKLIPIDQAQAMKLRRPALFEAAIPKGAYNGNPPYQPKPCQPLPQDGSLWRAAGSTMLS